MKNEINAVLENMTTTIPEPEDYTGEDGLLYCGKCRKPKEAYFAPDKAAIFGRDRHPAECDCQRTAREEREAAEKRRRHLDTVEELKRRGFTDPTMRDWTFENDNGRNPQTGIARRYVEHWEDMRTDNIGCLFWGGVGTGKSYLAGCIANALMEKEIPVHMTNFALKGKIRHVDGDFFLHKGVCDTARKVAFPGSHAAPEQAADIVGSHILPVFHIPAGNPGLRVPAVVVLKSPVPHGGVGKAPAFQFFHGVKVSAPLFGGFPFLAGGSLAVALCRVAVAPEDSGLIRRKIGFFRLAALAAVQ